MKELIGAAEAARRLRVSQATVGRWVESGRLVAAAKLSGSRGAYAFEEAELDRVAAERARELDSRRPAVSA